MSNKVFLCRRHFLQNAVLFSAGMIASLASSRLANAQDEAAEAVVIGSGFGGAVAALRLGQKGIKTLVLERGRRWIVTPAQNTFATYRNPDGRSAWFNSTTVAYDEVPIDRYAGILEYKKEDGISVYCGAGVGGGSLVYNAVTYQPPRDLFYRVFPREIDYYEMDSVYYPRAQGIIQAKPIPPDILATDYYLSTRLFLQYGENAELPTKLIDIALDWDIIRQEINGTRAASAIIGENWYGLNSGAMKSLDRTYLAQAEQTGNVDILPLHIVIAIAEVPGSGYRIAYNEINESGEILATKTITCRYLFLAAGSMGTCELLVKAKATGTLSRLNDYIGLGWTGNADIGAVTSGIPQRTNPGQGGTASAVIQFFENNPYGPLSIDQYSVWNASEGVLTSVAIPIPSVRGKFQYDSTTGRVKLYYPEDPNALAAAKFAYRIINRKNATSTIKPETTVTVGHVRRKNRFTTDLTDMNTVHPLGGAVLGKACDLYGRVLGYKGLYVVDSALIPGSAACTNPSFTIAALAERCMERIIAEDIH